MSQLRLPFEDEPAAPLRVPVYLRCPGCGAEWLSAILQPGAFWSGTPEQCAGRSVCAECGHGPPMMIVAA